jgi:hypothetical protein
LKNKEQTFDYKVVYHGRDPRIGAELTKRQLVAAIQVFATGRESSTRNRQGFFSR